MAKTKKKNKGAGGTKKKAKAASKMRSFKSSGGAGGQQEAKPKVENPFEIRVNRSKHDNLGRRARHEKGVPGISRSKAIEKRKETLLKEYKMRNKSSVLVDKRIGEKIKNMSEEEKIIRRSVVEKQRQYKQKSIFNLPSTDDILTHKGQVLMDIDRYEDPREESDSEDERLNEEFVSDAHFAGDFLKVKAKASDEIDEDEGKSRGDIIAELILNSKKRKMEKAKEADENYELVTKLDQEFKTPDFRNLLSFVKKGSAESAEAKEAAPPKKEDYDKIVRELHFEAKTGQAANRLKTEEEIQSEELDKLKKLEKERLRRMHAQDPTAPRHRSADELTDGYDLSDDVPTLSYQEDGTLNPIGNEEEVDDESSDSAGEEENSEEDSEEDEDDDAYSDLESDNEVPEVRTKKKSVDSKLKRSESANEVTSEICENDDIPYTLELPKSYESFVKLLTKYQALKYENVKCVIRFRLVVERIVKYNLLANKSRLPELFVYILRLIIERVEASASISDNIQKMIDVSVVNLHSILLTNPQKCVEIMESDVIQRLLKSPESEKNSKSMLMPKIVFYRICSKLFCVTDFCHKVLSPVKVDMLKIINSYNISTYSDLLQILALSNTMHDVSKESKRYCAEIVKLLVDIMEAIALPMEKLRFKRRRFEFLRISNLESDASNWLVDIMRLEALCDAPTCGQVKSLLLHVFDFANNIIQASHRTKAFNCLVHLVMRTEYQVLRMNWTDKKFHEELFLRKLSSNFIKPNATTMEDELPAPSIDRPKMLKLYEPMIEENFDGNRKRKQKRKGLTQEEARLSHKVKKEMKSAVREILKDNAFLAKQQLKEQAMKDAERSRKVKELLGSLSNQEGDYRKLKRQK